MICIHEKILKVHAAKTEEYLVGKALGDQDTVKGTKRKLYWLQLSIYTLFLEIMGFIQSKSYKCSNFSEQVLCQF